MSAAIDYNRLFHQRAMEARKRIESAKVVQRPEPAPRVESFVRIRARSARLYEFPIGPMRPQLHDIMLGGTSFAKKVLAEVSAKYGVREADVISDRRFPSLTAPRHEMMWRMRHETTWSMPKIGAFMRRDHTTILHGVRKHQERLDKGIAK